MIQGHFGAQEETLGSRLGFLSISDGFRDHILRMFGELCSKPCVFRHACLQAMFLFFLSGSEYGCLGLQSRAFGVRCVAKISFSHMLGFC